MSQYILFKGSHSRKIKIKCKDYFNEIIYTPKYFKDHAIYLIGTNIGAMTLTYTGLQETRKQFQNYTVKYP